MILQDALNNFLLSRRLAGLSTKTLTNYKDFLMQFINHVGKESDIEQLALSDVQNYIALIMSRPLSKATRSTYIRHVKIFLKWAEEEYGFLLPARKIKVPKAPRRIAKIYEPDEISLIFQVAAVSEPWLTARNRCMIALMYDSGLRRGELCNLMLKMISFKDKRLVVRGKGDKERFVPLGNLTIRYMQEYLDLRPYPSPYLFVERWGSPLTGNAVKQMVRKMQDKLPFELSCHKLRHNFGTNWCLDQYRLHGSMDVVMLQYIMGHEDIETTKIYLHLAYEILATQSSHSHLDILSAC